jgi:chemotaxis protein methyltransferase CheR
MTELLSRAEECFGIKAEPGDIQKLRAYIWSTYGGETPEIIDKVFSSGEAASFLTVNETYFFREPAHFLFLRELLPSFEKSGIQICCAAVSCGCEAYSVAMLIEDYNKEAGSPLSYHIDAFDIDPKMIETACRGIYGPRTLREDGNGFHFMSKPYVQHAGDEYHIDTSLKKNIRFFVHNIMEPISPKKYDLIFFRNAFIYFSQKNRPQLLSNLCAVLKEGGILLLGVSETSGVCHEDLSGKNHNNIFYFQKSTITANPAHVPETSAPASEKSAPEKPAASQPPQCAKLHFDALKIEDILSHEENAAKTAANVRHILSENPSASAASAPEALSGSELAASLLYLLKQGDFLGAGGIAGYMEQLDDSPVCSFLRGEYYFLQDLFSKAEFYYKIALSSNEAFWPAAYRIVSLPAADILKKSRAEKALKSIQKGRDLHYEVFIGGFSPNYYEGVLAKKFNLELCHANCKSS